MSDKYRKLYIIMSMSACWKRNARIILITGTMIIQKSFGLFEQIYKTSSDGIPFGSARYF